LQAKVKPPEENGLKLYCFHTFKNIHECWRGNVLVVINWCSTNGVTRFKQVEN